MLKALCSRFDGEKAHIFGELFLQGLDMESHNVLKSNES